MREKDQAERLSRALEEILRGSPPEDTGDKELNELLRIAKIRMDAARASAHAGAQVEGEVWRQVLARLGRLQRKEAGKPNGAGQPTADSAEAQAALAADNSEVDELKPIIELRRQMAARGLSLAEKHRDAVWRQIQSRLASSHRKGGAFSLFRRHPQADAFATAVDRLVLGEPIWEASDSRLAEIIRLAHARRAMGRSAAFASGNLQTRIWTRIRQRLMDRNRDEARTQRLQQPRHAWGKLATAAAALALVVAALGPIPATGLAGHPVAEFAEFLGRHAGILETGSAPTVPPVTTMVQGRDVTAAEAAELMGLPLRAPSQLPAGFRETSSRFFPAPLTASEGGVFLLSYSLTGAKAGQAPTLSVYQERAGGADVAVQRGAARDLVLADGTPATYIEGSWQPSGQQVLWDDTDAQALVFEREGVRTIIQYSNGARLDRAELVAVAEGLAVP